MSLRVAVAAPFKAAGTDRLPESEVVVALSIERDWFSPDEASRAVELAVDRDLLAREGDDLRALFDPGEVSVPGDFEPGADVLREQTVFESVLERIVADGAEKGAAVAAINERQRDLAVTPEAAAVLEARRRGLDVGDAAERALAELASGGDEGTGDGGGDASDGDGDHTDEDDGNRDRGDEDGDRSHEDDGDEDGGETDGPEDDGGAQDADDPEDDGGAQDADDPEDDGGQ